MTLEEKLKEAIAVIGADGFTERAINEAVSSCAEIVREEIFQFSKFCETNRWYCNLYLSGSEKRFIQIADYSGSVIASMDFEELYNLFLEEQSKQKKA